MPKTIGIREAKAQLSHLVAMAHRGDSITLTHRGRPMAKLVPLTEADETPETRIEMLKARGWIEELAGPATELPKIDLDGELAQRYLQEDRDG